MLRESEPARLNHVLCVTVVFLLLAWSTLRAESTRPVVLANDLVSFEFQPPRMGLSALVDLAGGVNHIRGGRDDYTVWELVFAHGAREQVVRNSGFECTGWEITPSPDGGRILRMEWRSLDLWKETDVMDVVVTVDLPPDRGTADWRISVDNRSDSWGLMEVRFPCFSGFLEAGRYDLAIPDFKTGSLHRNATGLKTNYWGYPSSGWPMAFLYAVRGEAGVYLGAHDPEAWSKRFLVDPGEKFYFTTFTENMGVAGAGYGGHYPAVIGIHRGGWLEACKLYRDWTLGQTWGSGGPLSGRNDIPGSMKELGLWMVRGLMEFGPVETRDKTLYDDGEMFLDANRYFGFPIGVQWYNWHHNRFDNRYPDFLPPRPGFAEVVRQSNEAGILLAPYINALSVDYDLPEFRERFHDVAVKDRYGVPEIVFYGDFASRMTFVCVSTERWHGIVTSLVDTLTGHYGCNSLYLDQIAAAKAHLCFDPDHGHPLGGGGWWSEKYRELCHKTKQVAVPRRAALTTEFFCEVYADCMDAFLTWEPPDDSQIPMVSAVYGGYALCYGSPMNLDLDDRIFMAVQARDFLWGRQVGWMGFKLFDSPEYRLKLEWLKKIGAVRMLAHKYLTYGEFMGMLEFGSTVDSVSGVWAPPGALTGREITGSSPLVMGALWRAEDGSLGVFLVNCLDRRYDCEFRLDPAVSSLFPELESGYDLTRVTTSGRRSVSTNLTFPLELNETLEPGEIMLLEFMSRGR